MSGGQPSECCRTGIQDSITSARRDTCHLHNEFGGCVANLTFLRVRSFRANCWNQSRQLQILDHSLASPDEMPELTKTLFAKQTEHEAAIYVRQVLSSELSNDYQVCQGASLLYRIEIDGAGKISNDGEQAPKRGHYAFQTDILVGRRKFLSLWSN
jgi:hypothetical protein